MDTSTPKHVRKCNGFSWENVDLLAYKDGGPYKDVTRQVLFEGHEKLPVQWRYFEVQPGGHSTLERHEHVHNVLILRGKGSCLVGDQISKLAEHDLIHVPSWTWHQFRAADDAPLGFLCLVADQRDKPQLPTESDLEEMRKKPEVSSFIRP